MSEQKIRVRLEQPVILEVEIPPEKLGQLQSVINLINKDICSDEVNADLSESAIINILRVPGPEFLFAPYFSLIRGYMTPMALQVVPER